MPQLRIEVMKVGNKSRRLTDELDGDNCGHTNGQSAVKSNTLRYWQLGICISLTMVGIHET